MINEDLLFYIGRSEKASFVRIRLSRDLKLVKIPEGRTLQTERTERKTLRWESADPILRNVKEVSV